METHRGTHRRGTAPCRCATSGGSTRRFRHHTGCRRDRSAASSGVPMTEPTGFAHGGDVPRSYLGAGGRSADVEGRSHLIFQPNIGGMTQINQSPENSGGVSAVLPRASVATAPPHGSVRRRSRPAQASVAVSSSLQVLHCSRDECAAQYLVAFGDGYCASVRLQAPRSAGRAPEQVQQGLGKADELYCECCPIRRGSPPP